MWTLTAAHVGEAGEQQREEEVEDDEVAHEDGGHEVGDARLAAHEDAVPHGLYPLPAQHAEHNHEAVHEVDEVPPGHHLPGKPVHIVCKQTVVQRSI